MNNPNTESFQRLLSIMDELREKCPWDKKQTLETLRPLTIEETYELSDAILKNDMKAVKEELGDLFLHLVFYSKIGSEKGVFTVSEVLNTVCDKLIARHPHIYGDAKVESDEEVKQNWEKLKLKEGRKSVLSGVPVSLPALIKAWRIQDKVKQVGFEWDDITDVWKKVEEELQELREVAQLQIDSPSEANMAKTEEELGDLLFAIINYARYLNIEPEGALERCNQKFMRRFLYIEDAANKSGMKLENMTLAEMDELWDEAKKKERSVS